VIGNGRPALMRLRRLTLAFARLGETGREFIQLPATTCAQTGVTLAAIADQVDKEDQQ
jgi:hypothetical protein